MSQDQKDVDATPLFDVPNLDDMSVDAGDYLHAASVFSLLAVYAEAHGRMMEMRQKGDMEAALAFEKQATHAYKRLPEWAKW